MEQKRSNKKEIIGIVGSLLVLGNLRNIEFLGNWNTAQMFGINLWTLVAIFGGSYLAYIGFLKK